MAEKKENHFRDRKFCLVLYPEDSTHVRALEIIKNNYDYAMILHNRDVYDDGEIKKEHWHVVLKTENNAIWNTALAKELGILPNYIERCRNLERALMYLMHYNDADKVQYELSEVNGTLKKRLKIALTKDDKTETEKAEEILGIIYSSNGKIRFTDVLNYAVNKGYYDVIRRATSVFMKAVEERNTQIELIENYENNGFDENLNDW